MVLACVPLFADICHQVLDLYSAQQQAQKQDGREASPPMSTGPRGPRPTGPRDTPPPPPRDPPPPPKRNRMVRMSDADAQERCVGGVMW